MGASECKPCSPADPVADTVKVDQTLLTQSPVKEQQSADLDDAKLRQEEALEQQRKDAEERQSKEAEERAEQERLQAEEDERQRKAEAAARRIAEEEAQRESEEARKRVEEEQRLQEEDSARAVAEAAEVARVKAEETKVATAKQLKDAKEQTDAFLKGRGFKSLTASRKAFCGASVHPIHLAVEENNAALVRAMVLSGADKNQKNAAGKTPKEIAEKLNKNGSHDNVLAALL